MDTRNLTKMLVLLWGHVRIPVPLKLESSLNPQMPIGDYSQLNVARFSS